MWHEWGRRETFKDFRKARRKETITKTKTKWIDNIKMEILMIGLDGLDRIGLAPDKYRPRALVNIVMNLRIP
jgi:hypothetical protein